MAEKKYKQREQRPRVSVATLPNGYALTIEGKEYLCFTTEQLVSEVFVRLAIGELEYMNKENVTAIMEACARWQDIKSALLANADLIAETRRAHNGENTAIRAQAKANERAERLQKEHDRLWSENVNLRIDIDALQKKLKKFDTMLVGGTASKKDVKLTKGQRYIQKTKR